jgi:hypothetical protein
MPQSFIACEHEQAFLLPSFAVGLGARGLRGVEHPGAVEELDLSAFYGAYRADGHGRPACYPAMMVALLLYGGAGINRHGDGDGRALHPKG